MSDFKDVSNEEFITGSLGISLRGLKFIPYFHLTKGKEIRKLTIPQYLDASLNNWINTFDKQTEYDKILDAIQNARLSFSALKYRFPQIEKETERIFIRLTEIENYVKYHQSKGTKTPVTQKLKSQPKYLLDIWEGTKEQYEKVIAGLKKEYSRPDPMPFLNNKKGKLFWVKYPKKGFVQYLKAFFYECIQKKWIDKAEFSANQFKIVVKNTFNIDVNLEPFKDMQNPPEEKYSKPFKYIPKNESSQSS